MPGHAVAWDVGGVSLGDHKMRRKAIPRSRVTDIRRPVEPATRAVFSVFFCLLTATAALAQPARAPEGAWVQDGIKWEKAPRTINRKLSSGPAAIAYFGADHEFALIHAILLRVQGEYEVICNGCGQVVYSGSWALVGRAVNIKYRLLSRTVEIRGEQLPGPLKEDTATIEGDAVVFLGHSFHRSSALDANVREFIPAVSP